MDFLASLVGWIWQYGIMFLLVLTLVVFVEKLLPRGRRLEGSLGVALVALGIVVSLGAIDIPWMGG